MDRFLWLTGGLEFNENKLLTQNGVKIYDGEEKVIISQILIFVYFKLLAIFDKILLCIKGCFKFFLSLKIIAERITFINKFVDLLFTVVI